MLRETEREEEREKEKEKRRREVARQVGLPAVSLCVSCGTLVALVALVCQMQLNVCRCCSLHRQQLLLVLLLLLHASNCAA